MRPRFVVLYVVILGIVAAALPANARDEWYDHYERAVEALEEGRPGAAIVQLERSLARKPRSGYVRTYGNNYLHYTPQFHLGVAHRLAGDCEQALVHFDAAVAASETRAAPGVAESLDTMRADCVERLRPPVVQAEELPVTAPEEPPPAPAPLAIDRHELETGVRAYLDGRFDEAAAIFTRITTREERSARLYLLQGASLHAAWATGGETSEELLSRANAALRRAAELGGARGADPSLFPPRVLALMRSFRPVR